MASNPSESKPPSPGSLQSMLARLRGMVQALKATEQEEHDRHELLPSWDATGSPAAVPAGVADALPSAAPAAEPILGVAEMSPAAGAVPPEQAPPPSPDS